MKSQILIDVDSYMSSVSLLEDGRLKEYYVEYKDSNRLTGNIYKGRVVNVLQGLETAFVDFGMERNGFLAVNEALVHRSVLSDSGKMPSKLDMKAGDFVMVQVTKEETGLKGARLTANISIPGRYVVYLPRLDFVGVSNKITDESERKRLMALLEKLKPAGGGFIARTASREAKKQDIADEARRLQKEFDGVCSAYASAEGVGLMRSEGGLIVRAVRDMISSSVESVVCNDRRVFLEVREALGKVNPRFNEKVKYFESDYDMSEVFGVLGEVDKLLEHKVSLPGGGTLVIDHAEALTAIDVNTGRFLGDDNSRENTVFRTNLEAAVEIARQLRLRNIGGIIIIDFIDMGEEKHRDAVVEALRKEMSFDRTKTRVLEMSELGLVEVTRKKTGHEIGDILLTSCPYCGGSAHTHSGDYIAKKIKARLMRMFADGDYSGASVTLSPTVLEHIGSSGFFSRILSEQWSDKRVYLVPDEKLSPSEFRIMAHKSDVISVPITAKLLY